MSSEITFKMTKTEKDIKYTNQTHKIKIIVINVLEIIIHTIIDCNYSNMLTSQKIGKINQIQLE